MSDRRYDPELNKIRVHKFFPAILEVVSGGYQQGENHFVDRLIRKIASEAKVTYVDVYNLAYDDVLESEG